MYLKEVTIKNFRSLKNVHISFDDTTILIGENNTGKSTILDAIRIGLNKAIGRTSFDDYDFYMDDKIKSPRDSEGIKITLMFEERASGEWEGYISDTFVEAIQYIDAEKASIIIESNAMYNEVTGDIETKISFLNIDYDPIAGKVQNLVNRFLSLTPVFYLQALRELRDTFSTKSPLWGKFMKKVSVPQNELDNIQNQIEQLNENIISNDNNLTSLVNELQKIQKVMDFQGKDLVSINAVPLKTWDLLSKAQVVLNNGTSANDFPLDRHGQGTQSVTAILLFKAYINILLKEISSDSAEAILTLEEPEAHLHPQAIRALQKSIEEMRCQKIITTHSPYSIQNADVRNIRYLRKNEGQTNVSRIKDHVSFEVEDISEGLKKIAQKFNKVVSIDETNKRVVIHEPINNKIEKGLRGCCKCIGVDIDNIIADAYSIFSNQELCEINMYIQRNRGDILFARKWFLYEGQTEDVIIPYFAGLLGIEFDENGINGIMYRNNGSAKAFIKLAKVLDIPWVVLGDNDEQGKTTTKEVINCGYSKEYVAERVALTNEKDIEHELAKSQTILNDYELLLGENISEEEKQLKIEGKDNEYRETIVSKIQKGKVENAYKLLELWNERGFDKNEIPTVIKTLIRKV